jgi:hypothetical protein
LEGKRIKGCSFGSEVEEEEEEERTMESRRISPSPLPPGEVMDGKTEGVARTGLDMNIRGSNPGYCEIRPPDGGRNDHQ